MSDDLAALTREVKAARLAEGDAGKAYNKAFNALSAQIEARKLAEKRLANAVETMVNEAA